MGEVRREGAYSPTLAAFFRSRAAIIAKSRLASRSVRSARCTSAKTESSTSVPSVASAARLACRPALTTPSTSIPTTVPRRNAIIARIAPKSDWSRVRRCLSRARDHCRRSRRSRSAKLRSCIARNGAGAQAGAGNPAQALLHRCRRERDCSDGSASRSVLHVVASATRHMHGGGALYPPDSPLLQKNALAAYDVSHARPWGWQVPAYCWTKAIGSGVLALPAFAMRFGVRRRSLRDFVLSTIALLFTAITALCCWFGTLNTRNGFLRVLFASAEQIVAGSRGFHPHALQRARLELFWLGARRQYPDRSARFCCGRRFSSDFWRQCYTAFLFGQCEGRDLWQTPLLPVHLIVQTLSVRSGGSCLAPCRH